MKAWLQKMLFDWVYVLLYKLLKAFLNLVDFIESFFDVFAGTAKIFYKGNSEFLINVFFGHDAVTNAFWAMALIAIVMAFGFCIVQLARKSTDITGAVKQSVGQILSNFFRCLAIIIMINAITVASINIANVLLDRINYAMSNASILHQEEEDRSFTEQEYATMAKVLSVVANYSVNPSSDSRYNVNSCFNAVRSDLLSLHTSGVFNYDYPLDENGHYSWQGALALLASSADLTTDLDLDTYYSDVVVAFRTVSRELSTYNDFAPVKTAHFTEPSSIDTDVLIFLITGMEASQNSMYNTGDFNDAIRKGYISGEKSYNDLTQVRKDFDIWEMDYLVGYVACIVFIIIMAICIFTFIVRMFNLLLLYITAPLFAASMPMDDGSKWQSWTQAFVIQLFSGFGIIIAMRLYLIIIPVVISSDLVFFAGTGTGTALLNRMAQLLMVLGGAWAVLQSGSVITGILAGNPGMAAIQQEGQIGSKVMGWATRAPRAALGSAVGLAGGAARGAKGLAGRKEKSDSSGKSKTPLRQAQQRKNPTDQSAAGKSARSRHTPPSYPPPSPPKSGGASKPLPATPKRGAVAQRGVGGSAASFTPPDKPLPTPPQRGATAQRGASPATAKDGPPNKPLPTPPASGRATPPNKPLPTPPSVSRARSVDAASVSSDRAAGAMPPKPDYAAPRPTDAMPPKPNYAAPRPSSVMPPKPDYAAPRPTPPNKPLPTPPKSPPPSKPLPKRPDGRS